MFRARCEYDDLHSFGATKKKPQVVSGCHRTDLLFEGRTAHYSVSDRADRGTFGPEDPQRSWSSPSRSVFEASARAWCSFIRHDLPRMLNTTAR
jgi:hypothetical protein